MIGYISWRTFEMSAGSEICSLEVVSQKMIRKDTLLICW